MNTSSPIYTMTAQINAARKAHQIWNHQQEEKWVADNIYAYNRGDFFVALTNSQNDQSFQPSASGFAGEGARVCNIFYPTSDCQNVSGGKLNITLKGGEAKIYVPASSTYFTEQGDVFMQ
jgi:hypothetical protein